MGHQRLWVKCGIAEDKMWNGNCATMVRPRDRSYYAVYRMPRSGKLRNADVESSVLSFYACCCHLLQSVFTVSYTHLTLPTILRV